MDFLTLASMVFLGLGSFLLFSGGLGLLRFPDFYTRIHATSISETLGAALIVFGLMCLTDFGVILFKLIFILLFLLFTAPTAGHTMAKAAQHGGLEPYARTSSRSGAPHDGDSK